jgi:hypothetical protein
MARLSFGTEGEGVHLQSGELLKKISKLEDARIAV